MRAKAKITIDDQVIEGEVENIGLKRTFVSQVVSSG